MPLDLFVVYSVTHPAFIYCINHCTIPFTRFTTSARMRYPAVQNGEGLQFLTFRRVPIIRDITICPSLPPDGPGSPQTLYLLNLPPPQHQDSFKLQTASEPGNHPPPVRLHPRLLNTLSTRRALLDRHSSLPPSKT